MAYSVVIGWVYVHARGSVLITSLLHGSINLSQGFFLGGVDPAREYWLLTAVYGTAALAVALVFGANLSRKHYAGVDRPRVQIKDMGRLIVLRTSDRWLFRSCAAWYFAARSGASCPKRETGLQRRWRRVIYVFLAPL